MIETRTVEIQTMFEGDDGWCEWVHPDPKYLLQCCDCGLVHEMEFALVPASKVNGLDDLSKFNSGETQKKVIVFRARRVKSK